jgi:hypothetical protein
MIYLLLDLSKAYNKVNGDFLFDYMGRLGILNEFVSMTNMLLIGSKARVINKILGILLLMNLVKKYPVSTCVKNTISSFWTSQFQHVRCD